MPSSLEQQTQIILDSIADGVFTVDKQWRITSFNRAAERITGISRAEALNRHCWEVFRASICEQRCALRETMETGRPLVNQSIFIVNVAGDRVPISISTALLRSKSWEIIGGVETFRDLSVVEQLRKELAGSHTFLDIISKNREMRALFAMLEQIAESNASVLLEGESGTGKELFAKAIHSLSPRRNGPMITVNCAALPDSLLESELFGYKAGAFTDARKDKPGRLARAAGGTLFLDEIGDISPMLQVRLLRVLQDRRYEPLGSTRSETADVRIVTATNRNLEQLVAEGRFRQDLFYRINVVKMILPPLRARKEDIPLLVAHFIRKYSHLNGKDIQGVAPEVMPLLMAHDFPGNVRELENIVEYAAVVCKNSRIGIEHLPRHFQPQDLPAAPRTAGASNAGRASFNELSRSFIYAELKKNNWNRKLTAAQLGIHPSTLWRRIKRLKVRLPSQDGRHRS
ncbi:MAG TPA: sigma 54-interacting transcriptional regulator [Desulfobacterales bacterium]|nr:sigma 54-interacting transcriptional regulator [Desulfobacterales bacterium]